MRQRIHRPSTLLAAAALLLLAPAAAAREKATFDVAGHPAKGEPGTGAVLIEMSDYQCGYCARANRKMLPQVDRLYVATGKLQRIFVDLPLAMHAHAFAAAEAGRCAEEQGKFWQMHDHLFAHQAVIAPDKLAGFAAEVGLDAAAFATCMSEHRHTEKIRAGIRKADAVGVRVTPVFLLGRRKDGGDVVELSDVIGGAKPLAEFRRKIDKLLAEQ